MYMLKQVLRHNVTMTLLFFSFIITISIILDKIIH
jgi:hypothetical protein